MRVRTHCARSCYYEIPVRTASRSSVAGIFNMLYGSVSVGVYAANHTGPRSRSAVPTRGRSTFSAGNGLRAVRTTSTGNRQIVECSNEFYGINP